MRTPRVDKNGLKQGAWSAEEDQKLIDYITRYRIWNWSLMPKFAGLSRNGKSCRLRWVNYLNPHIRRGNITKEEEQIIIDSYAKFGSRWSKIAARLPGRTDKEIKNYWHTHLKKLFKEEPTTRMKPTATEFPKVEAILEISAGSRNPITAATASASQGSGHMTPQTGLDDYSFTLTTSTRGSGGDFNEIDEMSIDSSTTIGDSYSLWEQTFFAGNSYMECERQEPYAQEWYLEEPSSPNEFFNNEYWLNDFPVMHEAEQLHAYHK